MNRYLLQAFFLSCFFYIPRERIYSQNLFEEKIRMLFPHKKNVYLRDGTFYKKGINQKISILSNIRRSYFKNEGRERVVVDFSTQTVPRIYGHISKLNKKIYLDIYQTHIGAHVQTKGQGQFLKRINFYPLDEDMLSIEFELSQALSYDIFYLDSPGRLVIDIKEN